MPAMLDTWREIRWLIEKCSFGGTARTGTGFRRYGIRTDRRSRLGLTARRPSSLRATVPNGWPEFCGNLFSDLTSSASISNRTVCTGCRIRCSEPGWRGHPR